MNIKKKFLIIFLLVSLFIIFLYVNRFEVNAITLSDLENQAQGFVSKGQTAAGNTGTMISSITSEFVGLGQILTTIGAGVMVVVTTYMGIKYIISPPDKQAALKQQLIGIVAAGVVIFGAYAIWGSLTKILNNNL